jgi:hypothetical protein
VQSKLSRIAEQFIKIAARAWKKNWGSLSPKSEQLLKTRGVWNPEQELKGLELGTTAKLVKHMENDPNLTLNEHGSALGDSWPGSAVTTLRLSRHQNDPQSGGIGDKPSFTPKVIIYGGNERGNQMTLDETAKHYAKGNAQDKSMAKFLKMHRESLSSGRTSAPDLSHETSEYEHLKPNIDKSYAKAMEAEPGMQASTFAEGLNNSMPSQLTAESGHAHPGVLSQESNNIRFLPSDIKKYYHAIRGNYTGEARTMQEMTGKRYGKDEFTSKDTAKMLAALKAGGPEKTASAWLLKLALSNQSYKGALEARLERGEEATVNAGSMEEAARKAQESADSVKRFICRSKDHIAKMHPNKLPKLAAEQQDPKLQEILRKFSTLLDKKGYEYFLLANTPGGIGHSKYKTIDRDKYPDSAVRNARQSHDTWETEHGFDPKHDWSKTANTAMQRNFLSKYNKQAETRGKLFHVVAPDNAAAFVSDPVVKSPLQLAIEKKPTSLESYTGSSVFSGKGGNFSGYNARPRVDSKAVFDPGDISGPAPHIIEKNKLKDALQDKTYASSTDSGDYLLSKFLDEKTHGPSGGKIPGIAGATKSGRDLAVIHLSNGSPVMQYGHIGVAGNKRSEMTGQPPYGQGESVMAPDFHHSDSTIELPTFKGQLFYNPKDMVVQHSSDGATYSSVDGYRLAKMLKAMGAIPVQSNRMYQQLAK